MTDTAAEELEHERQAREQHFATQAVDYAIRVLGVDAVLELVTNHDTRHENDTAGEPEPF